MGGQHGSWTVLGAVALCAILGAASDVRTFAPQEISVCEEDSSLMDVEVRGRQDDDGLLFSGYVYTPVPIDDKFKVVLKVHMPSGDTYSDDPMVLKFPDPCNAWKSGMPSLLETLAAIFNRKDPSCPVPEGNYSFTDQDLKLPADFPMLPHGLYKVHVESFQEDKKASCADLIMKLVDE